ncbi:CS1 type fimbrial major subunit [Pseudomonas fluorescens]|uniref:Adhesin n=1 Tax=Pseudomonas fluorescens TaxID=294 RepID=A0A7Z6MVF3_PSEFL|nr:CS1 type fimbrial major subunit [Pseudomonas fluorescens]RDS89356.1 adhesin [Pseudomonas fluorescens]
MLKKTAFVLPLIALAIGSSSVFAAGEATSVINIKATIPTKQFHVQPRDPNFGRDETMAYNTVSGELSSLRATYDVKNTDGSIKAYIEGGPASLTNGTASIALTNTFNGVVLTGSPLEVVDDASSTPGTQADLVVAAAKPADGVSGLFTTNYTIVFDHEPRVTP